MRRLELIGILNYTPDSFSDGGRYNTPGKAMARTQEMFEQGASIVDVGAESTRPGAIPLTADEEWGRVVELLELIIPGYTGSISFDTHHPENVLRAAQIGSFILNDVTGFNNPLMIEAAAEIGCELISSHLPIQVGVDIQTGHQNADMQIDSVEQVLDQSLTQRDKLVAEGIRKEAIKLDPGIGFAKPKLGWVLLKFGLLVPDHQVVIGYSKKKFLGPDRMELPVNLKAGAIAKESNAAYIRVHDVEGHSVLL
ncbi:dihydropteroate synthase [Candidatus Saccharibacteria bacterium]|nr:dihydropteroate synthase [Candidatus Saccharibacteria bacterium]